MLRRRGSGAALLIRLLLLSAAGATCTAVPVVDDVASNSSGSCSAALQSLCGTARNDVFKCATCAGENQGVLEHSGCTNKAISVWCAGVTFGIGDRLDRVYTKYTAQPTTTSAATAAGWSQLVLPAPSHQKAPCLPSTGTPWTVGGVRSAKTPVALHFSAAGQLAAITVDICCGTNAGDPWFSTMVAARYLTRGSTATEPFTLTVSFRNTTGISLCDPTITFDEELGDRVAVLWSEAAAFTAGPREVTRLLPLTDAVAQAEGYRRGSCFNGMGWHWFKDLVAANGTLSWEATALMPVVPMYNHVDGGNLNAIFFATPKVQQDGFPTYASNGWEPVPLSDGMMCANTCDSDCTFAGASAWSTMHWYFHDHAKPDLTCSTDPEIHRCITGVSCCPTL